MVQDEAKKFFDAGHDLRDQGRLKEALISFNKALALNPHDDVGWFYRGATLAELGRHRQATRSFERAIKISPGEDSPWVGRGESLVALGRFQDAIENYEKVLKQVRASSFKGLGLDYWQGMKMKAIYQLEQWLDARRPPEPFVKLYKLLVPSEENLHMFIRQRLQREFGKEETEWWAKGIPGPIRDECATRREHDPRRAPPYTYTDLIDLKEIIDKRWKLFEEDFQKIKDQVASKKEFLDSLTHLNDIRNLVMHPVRSMPSDEDQGFADKMCEVIQKFTNSE